jgi:hypothetical protein
MEARLAGESADYQNGQSVISVNLSPFMAQSVDNG